MSPTPALRGVHAPVVTPFAADLSIDRARFVAQCRWLTGHGVGLAVFGTNSEGTSLSVAERVEAIGWLLDAGIDPARLMPGTGGCALPEVVALTRAAVQAGAGAVLVLPPFYYKAVSDDGLFAFFSELIERVADARLRVVLYHIPPVSQVPISPALIERLRARHGGAIAGIKDSGGQWGDAPADGPRGAGTRALIERFAAPDFSVFAGSESFLLRTLRAGGAGCISATANVNPAAIAALAAAPEAPEADAAQAALDRVRALFAAHPMIAAMKSALADALGDPGWRRVRPPLLPLGEADAARLRAALAAAGFALPAGPR